MAERELKAQHGILPGQGTGFAVLGYGSLGGAELGFASDLDLVFVYDGARATTRSDGARPLDGAQWYQRLAQRIVHWLGALTRGGKLYEIDTRLRPDGAKGLLVTSVDAFAGYQNERAWTWEHQALVRARGIAGDATLHAPLDALRETILRRRRDGAAVRTEVAAMRSRWRQERDRSDATRIDLKQGAGTLLDIEFLLQGLVLAHAADTADFPAIPSSTPALLAWLGDAGVLAPPDATVLEHAHALFLSRALACTLDGRPRLAPREAALDDTAAQVLAVASRAGFVFS
jgi:glutamate-ammonia-ligase adenylyltransferase